MSGPLSKRRVKNQREKIADELAQIKADADRWNRMHPDEEPIVIDMDLTADVLAAQDAATKVRP